MSALQASLDILLGLALLWLAGYALLVRSATDAILGFIAFGMLMALVWLRLGSTDLAIAEAALGGGISGALLLSAQRRLLAIAGTPAQPDTPRPLTGAPRAMVIGSLALALGVLLCMALMRLPMQAQGLSVEVSASLHLSGVEAEVTAVLLNFRGYDTMLELSVLLAALLGVWHLGVFHLPQRSDERDPVLASLVRWLAPLMVLVTGYVLWQGGHAAGGAFQAGALLAGAGVLMLITQPASLALRDRRRLRLLIVTGPAVFTALALGMAWREGVILQYPPGQAGALILIIELASTFSIAITLLLLFAGGRPAGRHAK